MSIITLGLSDGKQVNMAMDEYMLFWKYVLLFGEIFWFPAKVSDTKMEEGTGSIIPKHTVDGSGIPLPTWDVKNPS